MEIRQEPNPELQLSNELRADLEQRQQLITVIKSMQGEVDRLTATISGAMVREGITEVEIGDYRVKYTVAERSTLDKTRLVELGVGTDVIAAATKTSTYGRIDVRERK